jgi:hypothetical protein
MCPSPPFSVKRRNVMKIRKKKTSGYAIFCSEVRRRYANESPDLQFADISKKVRTYVIRGGWFPVRQVAETSRRSRLFPPRSFWYDAVAFPTVSRVNSLVSGYVLLHLRSISDFTVKVKRLICYDNLCTDRRRRSVPIRSCAILIRLQRIFR